MSNYPSGTPSADFTRSNITGSPAMSPSTVCAGIKDSHSAINERTMQSSVGYEISLLQNFVNYTYLAREATPILSGYITNLISTSGNMTELVSTTATITSGNITEIMSTSGNFTDLTATNMTLTNIDFSENTTFELSNSWTSGPYSYIETNDMAASGMHLYYENLTTHSSHTLNLEPNEILFGNQNGALLLIDDNHITAENDMDISTGKDMIIESGDDLTITAVDELSITAAEMVITTTATTGSIDITSSHLFTINSDSTITLNPSNGGLIIKNLPISGQGLPTNYVYVDSNGFLKII